MNYTKKKTENLYVILVALLTVIAVVCAIAGAVNRSRKAASLETTGTEASALEKEDTAKDADEDEDEKEDVFNETPADVEDKDTLPTFINPTGGHLIKNYSSDTPVFSLTMEDYRTHTGVDVFVEVGERILASADGTVKEIWEDPMMGTCISLSHNGGAVSTYKNVSPELPENIKVGEAVTSGQLIAVGGESALAEVAEEPHVHFELAVGGKSVDPTEYITFVSAEVPYEG